jgi:hypothetical protein
MQIYQIFSLSGLSALRKSKWKLIRKPSYPKREECIVDEEKGKDSVYFESCLAQA